MTKLAKNAHRLWLNLVRKQARRRYTHKTNFSIKKQSAVPVTVVNAVNGERVNALVHDISRKKFQVWLSYKNEKAQVEEVFLKASSCFFHMSAEDWTDFPIILEVGSVKVPYLVNHASPRVTSNKTTTVSLFLRLADNVAYLTAILNKKPLVDALQAKIIPSTKKVAVKNKKKKKRSKFRLEEW